MFWSCGHAARLSHGLQEQAATTLFFIDSLSMMQVDQSTVHACLVALRQDGLCTKCYQGSVRWFSTLIYL
jgi:hypothetical protein